MSANLDESAQFSLEFAERLYQDYLRSPASVPADWRAYFDQVKRTNGHLALSLPSQAATAQPLGEAGRPTVDRAALIQERVDQLIRNYRVRGHKIASIDPLGRRKGESPDLELASCGLTEADLDTPLSTRFLGIHEDEVCTVRQIVQRLRNTYCRSIGVQFMHIDDAQVRRWLTERMESTENRVQLSRDEQIRIFKWLTDAVAFEQFLQTTYVGAKRFSLEGAETLIPLLDMAMQKAVTQGVVEVVLAMAHRGRLNVLANVVHKRPRDIFREFEDQASEVFRGGGDVKYHQGHSGDWVGPKGEKLHLSLCFNPSHLEYINPVAMGRLRAKQDRAGDVDRRKGLVVMIHGDAAFAGEGIIQETLNLSQLQGYKVGGALHIIVNNQIGFTTDPHDARSTQYATDVARMLQVPIFHVNGEDPEAVAQVVRLAMDFRQQFQRDVVIDLYCYRLLGHNEGDEPGFTQPVMYRMIQERRSVRNSYLDHLVSMGGITKAEAETIAADSRQMLQREMEAVHRGEVPVPTREQPKGLWQGYHGGSYDNFVPVNSGVPTPKQASLLQKLASTPADFQPHPRIAKFLEGRRKMAAGAQPLDWAAAEAIAMASLLTEGYRIRMSGQDVERGTFSHRHVVLHDHNTGAKHCAMRQLAPEQGAFDIYNSPLSESGVLGFEYGYSLDCPNGLVMWEAQFGDFANVAQPVIDQFIASAESKWQRLSSLVMLLPHGMEGQGPEHSSARLERFLALGAQDNILVTNPTTPAQYFHLLRQQVLSKWRKPLVVMTPKSLLRHKGAVSSMADLSQGRFQPVLADCSVGNDVQRILVCSGKIYYELLEHREELKRSDVAIVRLEQLYPLPKKELASAIQRFPAKTPVYYVQEESENMGAWRFLQVTLGDTLPMTGITRPASASPATGSAAMHKREQQEIIQRAFADLKDQPKRSNGPVATAGRS